MFFFLHFYTQRNPPANFLQVSWYICSIDGPIWKSSAVNILWQPWPYWDRDLCRSSPSVSCTWDQHRSIPWISAWLQGKEEFFWSFTLHQTCNIWTTHKWIIDFPHTSFFWRTCNCHVPTFMETTHGDMDLFEITTAWDACHPGPNYWKRILQLMDCDNP